MPRIQAAALAVLLSAAASFCGSALAQSDAGKPIRISDAFVRATPPGARVAGAFMTITNQGAAADRLVSARSPVAGRVEIHEMAVDGGMMTMRAVKGIDIGPGAAVQLKPGGYHVMLEELKQPLKQGESVPVQLTFEKAGVVDVTVRVEAMGAAAHAH